jgi:hypothetical protein
MIVPIKETSFGNPVFRSSPFQEFIGYTQLYLENGICHPATKANRLFDLLEILPSSLTEGL